MPAAVLILGIAAVVAGWLIRREVVARRNRWIEIIDAEGERHRISLPPHSVRGRKNPAAPSCFTTAAIGEVIGCIFRSLESTGWEQCDVGHDPPGVRVVFRRAEKRLRVHMESALVSRRRLRIALTFSVAVGVQPTPLERELEAIKALGKPGNPEAVAPLVAQLADERPRIRWAAVSALAVLRDERSVEPLAARLADADEQIAQQAAKALGAFGDSRAVMPLAAGLAGRSGDLAAICAHSLGRIKDPRAVPALIAALGAPYARLKLEAALALYEIKDRSAVEPLRACFKDPRSDWQLRSVAYVALKQFLSAAEISALLRELPHQPGEPSFEGRMKDALAESVAEVSTEAIFDLLGWPH